MTMAPTLKHMGLTAALITTGIFLFGFGAYVKPKYVQFTMVQERQYPRRYDSAIIGSPIEVKCAQCVSKIPCRYQDEVDLRLIVFTYDRTESLRKCLNALVKADYMGDTVALEIWIDISKDGGKVNKDVLEYANTFEFKHGRKCVHIQTEHVNIAYQWIYSWQPKSGTEELAVFIEDDTDVSVYFYRYLKSVRMFYRNLTEINVYCLTDENIPVECGPRKGSDIIKPKGQKNIVFLYPLLCTWGFAPEPAHWRHFQDWFHNNVSNIPNYDPTTPEGALTSDWYRSFKQQGKADTMLHEIFLIKYNVLNNLYTLYPNIGVLTSGQETSLTSNRKEKGLHYFGKADLTSHTLKKWRKEFVNFPQKPIKFNWAGERIRY